LPLAVFIPGVNEDSQLTVELSDLDFRKEKQVTVVITYVLLEENGFAVDGHPAVFGRSNCVAANL
jgi:hypothetical protein